MHARSTQVLRPHLLPSFELPLSFRPLQVDFACVTILEQYLVHFGVSVKQVPGPMRSEAFPIQWLVTLLKELRAMVKEPEYEP